jgi:hypothetical protein
MRSDPVLPFEPTLSFMKTKELGDTLLRFRYFSIISLAIIVVSCDVLESDPDVLEPTTNINGREIYVLANSSSIVDLNAKLQTNIPVRIALTSEARYGKINDLGKGLLQYSPSVGNARARDGFEFTVYTLNNEVVKRDSVIIYIENDSTNLPCNIYPMPDYVYGVNHDPVTVDVTSNDIICGGNVVVSIYKPENSFPPYFGQAEVIGNKIKYIPNSTFHSSDKIVYKISNSTDTSRAAYGIVYLTRDSVCSFRLGNDQYISNEYAVDSLITIPVFQNDSLCHAINQYQVNLKVAPAHGQASPVSNGFNYKVPATVSFPFSDYFTYEVCIDASCRTARVDIKLKKDSMTTCAIKARADSVDISSNNNMLTYLDVLLNDTTCGNLNTFRITKSPSYGTSTVINRKIAYERNALQEKDDTLEYEICNGEECSSAVVYIKRTK